MIVGWGTEELIPVLIIYPIFTPVKCRPLHNSPDGKPTLRANMFSTPLIVSIGYDIVQYKTSYLRIVGFRYRE